MIDTGSKRGRACDLVLTRRAFSSNAPYRGVGGETQPERCDERVLDCTFYVSRDIKRLLLWSNGGFGDLKFPRDGVRSEDKWVA